MCTCNKNKTAVHQKPVSNAEQEFESFLSELHDRESEEKVYSNERTMLQEVMEEFEDANPAPLPFKHVPFAPLPPEGSYWPLISKNKLMPVISYNSSSGKIGKASRRFGAGRTGGRYHAGIDLYANHRDPVVAIDKGVILAHYLFCCGKKKTSYNLLVKHSNVVVTYGEVDKDLPNGLTINSEVLPGQIIAFVGKNPKGSSMLHFELYTPGTTTNHKWLAGKKAPANLLDPTLYLLYLKNFGKQVLQDSVMQQQTPEPGMPVINAARAAKRNASFSGKIGWGTHLALIQKRLETSAAPHEEAFAHAVANWQKAQGYIPKTITGILDRVTWNLFQKTIDINYKMSKRIKGPGWVLSGGRQIKWVLCDLKRKGLLNISPNEMEMLRLVSSTESKEKISAINTWDKVFLSMGFTQFTIGANTIQPIIERAPAAFKKYGIELVSGEKYPGKKFFKIKGTTRPEELRSFAWAEKFYKAGLDEEIIVALVQETRVRLNALLAEADPSNFLRTKFVNHRFPNFWAHIYESNNAAPTPFKKVLRESIALAIAKKIEDPVKISALITNKFAKVWHRARPIAKNMGAGKVTVLDDANYCN
jgi:murein DD-endopeptidase MepM/ murein hydrolase activator NlpD